MKEFRFTSIGSDPEFFLVNLETDKPTSYFEVYDSSNLNTPLFNAYADNVLMELSFEPCNSLDTFADKVQEVVEQLSNKVGGHGMGLGFAPTMLYDKDQLCDMRAHQIGCEPFFSCYQLGSSLRPMPYSDGHRHAGGHIHLGYDKSLIPEHVLVRFIDEALYYLSPDFRCERRDAFYGQQGTYRSKPYGVEYRSLPNVWLDPSKPHLLQTIIEQLKSVEDLVNLKLQAMHK